MMRKSRHTEVQIIAALKVVERVVRWRRLSGSVA